jgi:hypothetical protein
MCAHAGRQRGLAPASTGMESYLDRAQGSRPNSRSMRSVTLSRSNLAPSLTLTLPLSPSRSLSRARALSFSLAFFLSCSLSHTRVRSLSLSLSRCRVPAVLLSRAARPRCRRLSLCHGRVSICVYVWCVVVYCVVCCVVCIRACVCVRARSTPPPPFLCVCVVRMVDRR